MELFYKFKFDETNSVLVEYCSRQNIFSCYNLLEPTGKMCSTTNTTTPVQIPPALCHPSSPQSQVLHFGHIDCSTKLPRRGGFDLTLTFCNLTTRAYTRCCFFQHQLNLILHLCTSWPRCYGQDCTHSRKTYTALQDAALRAAGPRLWR